MSTKFFTNAQENTLLKKLEGIFSYTRVHAFDALVGYFRASGYFRIREWLKEVPSVRILVGINVDHLISEAARKGLEFKFNAHETRDAFAQDLVEDIQQAEYTLEVEDGMKDFISGIAAGQIQIKAHPNKNLHAKIYIFRPEFFNEHVSGSVITGSSNLTDAGLEKNFEFNVELRDFDDVAFATRTFEELWAEGIDIQPEMVEEAKKKTYIYDAFTPFEVYIKFLLEYFGASVDYDPESAGDLPQGYMKLAYQIDAVNDGYQKLLKHNGFILADVVGLGKTIIATMIAKKFFWSNGPRTRILVVMPPALEQGWKRTVRDFDVPGFSFVTNGSLHKVAHPEDYDLIIVDEAHKFRSDTSNMFDALQKICKTPRRRPGPKGDASKKVMLITATPLNNKPEDIRNQLLLFQDGRDSTLEIGNLISFFRPLIDEYNRLRKSQDSAAIKSGITQIYGEIREKVLKSVIVRRTRTDILASSEYEEDIKKQGLVFPSIAPPRQLLYQLDERTDALYTHTFGLIKDVESGLRYLRYQAIRYLKPEHRKHYKQAERISLLLASIMKTLLVKRIDSSFHAFKISLKRYQERNRAMIRMFENDRIYIAHKIDVSDFINSDQEQELLALIERADLAQGPDIRMFGRADFEDGFLEGLSQDQAILDSLAEQWDGVRDDPKLRALLAQMETVLFDPNTNPSGQLVIFSEAADTTLYLKEQLQQRTSHKILAIHSKNLSDYSEAIARNFDANYPAGEQACDYSIIITTEVLAEGVNLHRANVLLNYDIPWNATRLMQRIGRVNRVGSRAPAIFVYNFFPTAQADSDIELNKKAFMKLQGFHAALGEDSQIYSDQEEFESFGLFAKAPEDEKDERLAFLFELRRFKAQHPEAFERIRNMPKRARTGRKDATRPDTTLAFIRTDKRDGFYFVRADHTCEVLSFVETAKIFRATPYEKAKPLHRLHHSQVAEALRNFASEQLLQVLGTKASGKLGPNEQKAAGYLQQAMLLHFVAPADVALMKEAAAAIRNGRFQQLPRELNALIKNAQQQGLGLVEQYHAIVKALAKYPLQDASKTAADNPSDAQIIISESFGG